MAWPSTTQIFWPNLHNQKSSQALIDTGSSASFIPFDVLRGEESLKIKSCHKVFSTVSEPIVVTRDVKFADTDISRY